MKRCTTHLRRALRFACVLAFLVMAARQYASFRSEHTGSMLSRGTMGNLPFPAVTVCDQHYDLGRAWEELGLPSNVLGRKYVGVAENPSLFYLRLEQFGLPIYRNLWKYYFTLDAILYRHISEETRDDSCVVGGKSCSPKHRSNFKVAKEEDEPVVNHVSAGEWTSRLVADSSNGALSMCHTLVPNVTADFSSEEGHAVEIKWMRETFSNLSSYWKVYVHDRNEHFLPDTYAIETMAKITLTKLHSSRAYLIRPKLSRLPDPPSQRHPCEGGRGRGGGYSENLCNIRWGWDRKLEAMEAYFGINFTCQIPGILSGPDAQKRPVCERYYDSPDGQLGLLELTHELQHGQSRPSLGRPPVGVYKDSSPCVARCRKFLYELEEQARVYNGMESSR